jgi:hypothetical protein
MKRYGIIEDTASSYTLDTRRKGDHGAYIELRDSEYRRYLADERRWLDWQLRLTVAYEDTRKYKRRKRR